jgi:hypothetical protein
MSEAAQNTTERLAIQALAGTLNGSMQAMATTAEVQQIAILGIGAILACLPDTAKIPQEHLSAALAMLTQGRSKEFADKLANFMGTAVAASRMIPAVAAKIEATAASKN